MKLLVVFGFVLLVTLGSTNPVVVEKWTQFKITHKKTYENQQEELRRLEIFKDNLKKIEEHNKLYEQGTVSYKMGVNQFADLTADEFLAYLKRSSLNAPKLDRSKYEQYVPDENAALPDKVDWRESGAVTPVKDQGQCGSCWTFSTTGSLESQQLLKTGEVTILSEQELVDCITDMDGCDGGLMQAGFDYVQTHGITSEDNYPYEARDGPCRRGDSPQVLRSTSYVPIEKFNEDALKSAVATAGPIAIAVDASNWSFYESGLYYDEDCGNSDYILNHEVLLIGYGTEDNGEEYWLIKNSWGNSWGEEGYMKSARNNNNQCGVATDANYPVL